MGLRNGSDKKKSRKNQKRLSRCLMRLLPRAEISLLASLWGLFGWFGFKFGDFSGFGGQSSWGSRKTVLFKFSVKKKGICGLSLKGDGNWGGLSHSSHSCHLWNHGIT